MIRKKLEEQTKNTANVQTKGDCSRRLIWLGFWLEEKGRGIDFSGIYVCFIPFFQVDYKLQNKLMLIQRLFRKCLTKYKKVVPNTLHRSFVMYEGKHDIEWLVQSYSKVFVYHFMRCGLSPLLRLKVDLRYVARCGVSLMVDRMALSTVD